MITASGIFTWGDVIKELPVRFIRMPPLTAVRREYGMKMAEPLLLEQAGDHRKNGTLRCTASVNSWRSSSPDLPRIST